MGTIINPTPAATMLEEQRLGYVGCSLTNFDSTAEPQIVGNFEVAGSLGSFASAESITGWSGLSNGDVYIKVVPDTGAGTVAAEFTSTAPTWDSVKNGWYGTGASANHRYLFKLNKTGASGYEDKRFMNRSGDALEVHYRTDQDLRTTDNAEFETIKAGNSALKVSIISGTTTAGGIIQATLPSVPSTDVYGISWTVKLTATSWYVNRDVAAASLQDDGSGGTITNLSTGRNSTDYRVFFIHV